MANYILKKDGNLYNKKTNKQIPRRKIDRKGKFAKEYYFVTVNGKPRRFQCDEWYKYPLNEYNVEVEND